GRLADADAARFAVEDWLVSRPAAADARRRGPRGAVRDGQAAIRGGELPKALRRGPRRRAQRRAFGRVLPGARRVPGAGAAGGAGDARGTCVAACRQVSRFVPYTMPPRARVD